MDDPRPGDRLAFDLVPHPAASPHTVSAVVARINAAHPHWLRLRWRIEGSAALVVPPLAGCHHAEGLWQTTCFELFVQAATGEGYSEYNLSPSENWAAYDFAAPREGMTQRPMPRAPVCTFRPGKVFALFDAAVPLAGLPPRPWRFGLSAVIEEPGAALSYWALGHASERPDFHDPACFTGRLAAPGLE